MPDLMSHLIIGLILAELLSIRKKSLVILGALMPDVLSKLFLVYVYFNIPPVVSFVPFHTPFMMLLLSILIAPLFNHNKIKTLLFINLGSISHFLSDMTMKHFGVIGSRLLFPFSLENYTLNLIWPNNSFYILMLTLLIYLVIVFTKKRRIYIDKKFPPVN